MKIHSIPPTPLAIESIVEFKPWPFKDDQVDVKAGYFAGDVLYDGPEANGGIDFLLCEDEDDTLVTLSDGRLIVTQSTSIPALRAKLNL